MLSSDSFRVKVFKRLIEKKTMEKLLQVIDRKGKKALPRNLYEYLEKSNGKV